LAKIAAGCIVTSAKWDNKARGRHDGREGNFDAGADPANRGNRTHENRRPSEVLEDAWRRYVEEKWWAKLVERGRENAKRLGIQESDVDRLISDYRAEKRAR
jgi:hypothetical protein